MRLPLFSAAVLGASLLMLPVPSSAAPLGGLAAALPVQSAEAPALLQKVQYHYYHGGHRYYGHRHGGSDAGAVAAGAIIGLAVGAMIASQAAQHNRSVAWCMRRYRSYNPHTGTWVDYSGRIRYCP